MIGSPVHPLPHSPPNPPKQQDELMVPSIVEGAMVILCQCLGPIWLSIFQFSCWERNAMSNQLSNRDRFLWSFSLHWPWISSSGRISGRYLFWFIRFECIIAIFDNCLEFFRSVHIPKQSCLHASFLSYSNSRVMKSPFGGLNSHETSMKRTCTRDIPSMFAHQLIRQPRMNICRCLKFSATGCFKFPFEMEDCCNKNTKCHQNSQNSHWSCWWLKSWNKTAHEKQSKELGNSWHLHKLSTEAKVHLVMPFGGDPSHFERMQMVSSSLDEHISERNQGFNAQLSLNFET